MQQAARELLGKTVRSEWIAWAREQENPKSSWLVPWEELPEQEKEADRRIAEAAIKQLASWLIPFFQALLSEEDVARLLRELHPAPTSSDLAAFFHERYEALAPSCGYETRPGTAKPWNEIPPENNNKRLMIAVCGEVLKGFF